MTLKTKISDINYFPLTGFEWHLLLMKERLCMVPFVLILLYLCSSAFATLQAYNWDLVQDKFGLNKSWCDSKYEWCDMEKETLIENLRTYARIHPYYYYYQSENIVSPYLDNFSPVDIDIELQKIEETTLANYAETQLSIVRAFAKCHDLNYMYVSPLENDILSGFYSVGTYAYFFLPFTLSEDANGEIVLRTNEYLQDYNGVIGSQSNPLEEGVTYQVLKINDLEPLEYIANFFPYFKEKANSIAYTLKYLRGGTMIRIKDALNTDDVCIRISSEGKTIDRCYEWAVLLSYDELSLKSYGFEHDTTTSEENRKYQIEEQFNEETLDCIIYTNPEDTVNFPLAYVSFKYHDLEDSSKFTVDMEKCKSHWKNIKKYVYDTRDMSHSLTSPDYYDAIYSAVVVSDFSISPSTDLFAFHFEEFVSGDEKNASTRDSLRYDNVKVASYFIDPITRKRDNVDPFTSKQQILSWRDSSLDKNGNDLLVSHFSRVERFPTPTIDEWVEFRGGSLSFTSEYNRSRSKDKKRAKMDSNNATPSYDNTMVLVDGTCIKDCAIFVNRVLNKGYAKVISTFPDTLTNKGFGIMTAGSGGGSISASLSQFNDQTQFALIKYSDLVVGHYIVHVNVLPDTVGVQLSSSSQYGGEFVHLPVDGAYPCTTDCIDSAVKAFGESNKLSLSACQSETDSDSNGIRYAKYNVDSLEGSELNSKCVKFDCPNGYGLLDGECVLSTLVVTNKSTSIVILAVAVLGSLLASAVGFGLLTKCLIDKKKAKNSESQKLMG